MYISKSPTENLPTTINYPVPVDEHPVIRLPGANDGFVQAAPIRCTSCHCQNLSWNRKCSWCGAPMKAVH